MDGAIVKKATVTQKHSILSRVQQMTPEMEVVEQKKREHMAALAALAKRLQSEGYDVALASTVAGDR